MGITLGEYDYICRKIRRERLGSAWHSPASVSSGVALISDRQAPEGKAYLRVPAGDGGLLRSPDVELRPNRPHLLSMWARNNKHIGGGPWFWSQSSPMLAVPLVQNLPNGPHTLEILSDGTGTVAVEAFHIFEPLLK
jgi:hypothetical protein